MTDVSRILAGMAGDDPQVTEQILPLVYDELRRLASPKLAAEAPGQTLQTTALVHEAYARLIDVKTAPRWQNERHFFAAAAEAMRRILVENARRKKSLRHGAGRARRDLLEGDLAVDSLPDDLLDLNDALLKLAQVELQAAELVKLHLFTGLTIDESAEVLGISPRAAKRHWTYARAWLRRQLSIEDDRP